MEGERLLQRLRDGTQTDNLVKDVQVYFAPVGKVKQPSCEIASKYGLTAMKLLRACVQTTSSLGLGSKHLIAVTSVAHTCYDCIRVAQSQMKITPLSLEKLLFHMMMQLANKGLLMDAMSFAKLLFAQLAISRPRFENADGVDNEFDTIAKQAFNQLWKVCAQIEVSSKTGARHELVLDARNMALAFLMLTNHESAWVAERALRAGIEFERHAGKEAACPERLFEFFDGVAKGLLQTLESKLVKGPPVSDISKMFGPALEVILQLAKYSFASGRAHHALDMLARVRKCVSGSKVQSEFTVTIRLVSAICDNVGLSCSLSTSACESTKSKGARGKGTNKLNNGGMHLTSIVEQLERTHDVIAKIVEIGSVEAALFQPMVDSYELLRKRLENFLSKGEFEGTAAIYNASHKTLLMYVDVLQSYKEHLQVLFQHPTDGYRGMTVSHFTTKLVNKQLTTLNFLANLAVQELNTTKQPMNEEVKGDDSGSRAITVCKRTKAIMEDVSAGGGGVISVNEHRWLGSSAYNLGLICYKKSCYGVSQTLLKLACEHLQLWCSTEQGLDVKKVQEIQLAKKYELLADCQRRSGNHRDAMTTVALGLLVIPGLVAEDISSRAEQWVKAKRDALKTLDEPNFRDRTLLSECQEMESDFTESQLSVITTSLHAELKVYKTQRHDTSVEQCAVIHDLLRACPDQGGEMERATALIQLAQLLYSTDVARESSPEECCMQAIELLKSQTPKAHDVHYLDLLAQAKFWLYLCQLETKIQHCQASTSYDVAMDLEQESSLTIPDDETQVSISVSQETCLMANLEAALELWASALHQELSEPSSFQDPQATIQCLQLAADVLDAADKTVELIWVLSMVSKLAHSTCMPLQAVESDARLARLLAKVGHVSQGSVIISRAEEVARTISESKGSTGVFAEVVLSKAAVLLLSGQVHEFEETFSEYLNHSATTSGHRSCRTYLRTALAKELQSAYLAIPTSLRTPGLDSLSQDEYGEDLSPCDLELEAMRLRMGVAKIVMGAGMETRSDPRDKDKSTTSTSSADLGNQSVSRWQALASMLQSLSQVADCFSQQGCVREAQCYITEGMTLSQKFHLPRRYARYLQQLVTVQVKWGQVEEVQSTLTLLKSVITSNNQETHQKPTSKKEKAVGRKAKKKTKSKGQKSVSEQAEESDDEENFIRSRPFSFSKSLADCVSTDMSNSPSLRPAPATLAKLPSYTTHHQDCSCAQCTDISLHELDSNYYLSLARYCLLLTDYEEGLSAIRIARQILEWCAEKLHQALEHRLTFLGDSVNQRFSWTAHEYTLGVLLSAQVQLEIEAGNIAEATSVISEGITQCEQNSAMLAHDAALVASFHYYSAIVKIQQKSGQNSIPMPFDSSWSVICGNKGDSGNETEIDDVASRLGNLNLSVSGKTGSTAAGAGPSCRLFQSMLDTSSTRPEVTRKRDSRGSEKGADLSEEFGLFDDVTCSEESEVKEQRQAKGKPGRARARPKTALQVASKKGAMTFKVERKASKATNSNCDLPQNVPTKEDFEGIFSFDDESAADNVKKRAKGRSKKGALPHKITSVDKGDNDSTATTKTTSRGKGRGAKKKEARNEDTLEANSDAEISQMVDEVMTEISVKTKSVDIVNEAESKPRRGRGRRGKESTAETLPKETMPKGRRGRASKSAAMCDIETARGIPDPRTVDDYEFACDEVEEVKLLIDSSPGASSPSPCAASALPLRFTFDKTGPEVSISEGLSDVSLTGGSTLETSLMSPFEVLSPSAELNISTSSCPPEAAEPEVSIGSLPCGATEDFDDIEVPRGGSDSEDATRNGRRRGRGARKTTGKTKPKVVVLDEEEVETNRGGSKDLKKQTRKSRPGTTEATIPAADTTANSALHNSDVSSIRESLDQAFNLMKHIAPSPMYRHTCQLLALCHGDANPEESSHYLALAAAVTLRHQKLASLNKKLRKLRKASEKEDSTLQSAMDGLSLHQSPKMEEERLSQAKRLFTFNTQEEKTAKNIINDLKDMLPAEYTVCQLSVISCKPSDMNSLSTSSRLVVTRLQRGREPIIIQLPMTGCEDITKTFERILTESKETVKETDKKIWWTTRQRLDEQMQSLTKDMENNLLGCWKGAILGNHGNEKAASQLSKLAKKLHKSIQQESQKDVSMSHCELLIDSYDHLSRQQTNVGLSSLTGLQPGSDALTQLSLTLKALAKEWQETRPDQRNPVILILDAAIQHLPWENLPILQQWPVCRLPSLHFLLDHLHARQSEASVLGHGVDPKKTYFILNPTGDLLNTQKTFQEWFQKENGWEGVVGRAPTKPEFTSALADHDLFVFCGHGTGREFLTGDDIQRLKCRAATLLIGCSSGKLQVNGCLDASGMALNYLLAECPCVVANLWDVTDRDIDRFLEYLLKAWLNTGGRPTAASANNHSLASLLNSARQACKLRHLIGYSPVIYGLPAFMQE
ncbi:separin-like [Diadema antillarum]|uniref:separin-like n=1 Tax=Diadema antillarum TaxID=105358 RepID=UPI003A85696A